MAKRKEEVRYLGWDDIKRIWKMGPKEGFSELLKFKSPIKIDWLTIGLIVIAISDFQNSWKWVGIYLVMRML